VGQFDIGKARARARARALSPCGMRIKTNACTCLLETYMYECIHRSIYIHTHTHSHSLNSLSLSLSDSLSHLHITTTHTLSQTQIQDGLLTTPFVSAAMRKHFNCTSLLGAPVLRAHWNQHLLNTELMASTHYWPQNSQKSVPSICTM
jgi:hypothetical protein